MPYACNLLDGDWLAGCVTACTNDIRSCPAA